MKQIFKISFALALVLGFSSCDMNLRPYSVIDPDNALESYADAQKLANGFNNQIRFNKSGEFNLPVGKRDFNARMRKKLTTFHERMSELTYEFFTQDFRAFDVPSTPQDTVFYCDPPYLITQATYNERGGWSVSDEEALLSFLDGVHSSGRKFALSNVLKAKGVTNALLEKWSENPDYHVHYLKMSYDNSNYRRAARGSDTIEVLITNYP